MTTIEALGPGYWQAWSGDMAAALVAVLVLAIVATSIPVAAAIARLFNRWLGTQARQSISRVM